jgi:toxin-antitoxin system PIN domain toxin
MALQFPDANILIHCLREEASGHRQCRQWLEGVAEKEESLALCELVEVAFLRITTLPSLYIAPIKVALDFWGDLQCYPGTVRLIPGNRHHAIFRGFVEALSLSGNDLNDAWLAALAVEHKAILVSADQGFHRFTGLQWLNPLSTS